MAPNKDDCVLGAENKTRIDGLEGDIAEMKVAIACIRDKLLGRLPNWATLMITALTAIAAGLVVALVK